MNGDTVQRAVEDITWYQEWIGVPNGVERMLQGADLEAYREQLRKEYREQWMFESGLTENDVYGQHAHPRPHQPGEGLDRWQVTPKSIGDPNYVGEHRCLVGEEESLSRRIACRRRPHMVQYGPDKYILITPPTYHINGTKDDGEPTKGYVAQ